jgi:hypothetical protein
MGLGAFIDAVGDETGRLLRSAQHKVGSMIDDDAHLAGAGLDFVGLHGAADWVEDTGDLIADQFGVQVAEQQLGQSEDPGELLHGDPGGIRAAAGHLRRLRTAFDTGRTGLSRLDPGDWGGAGGDAFRAVFAPQPERWSRAAQACQEASEALETYAYTVDWARGQAGEAVRLFRQGAQARRAALEAYDAKAPQPGPFDDPGAGDRNTARELLAAARGQRDVVAGSTEQAVRAATGLAPDLPGFTDRLTSSVADLVDAVPIRLEHFAGGVVRSATDALRFTRGLNPYDPYNVLHPMEYLTRLNSTAAGLLDLAVHPERLPAAVLGTGWGADRDEAGGRLIGNVLLAIATDGGSAAGGKAAGWRNAVPGHGAALNDIRSALRGGPDGLQPVKAADQRKLEAAVPRNSDGSFLRYPDPRGDWVRFQNDGGTKVAGRANNCADAVRAALETWYGNPQVAAARTVTRGADGTLDVMSAERFGVENGNVWGGTTFGYTGPGPAAYQRVADELRQAGHGSSSFVHVEWPRNAEGARTAHVFTALNHNGEVLWYDPQSGVVSKDPIHHAALHVHHYVLDADRRPFTPAASPTSMSGAVR